MAKNHKEEVAIDWPHCENDRQIFTFSNVEVDPTGEKIQRDMKMYRREYTGKQRTDTRDSQEDRKDHQATCVFGTEGARKEKERDFMAYIIVMNLNFHLFDNFVFFVLKQ